MTQPLQSFSLDITVVHLFSCDTHLCNTLCKRLHSYRFRKLRRTTARSRRVLNRRATSNKPCAPEPTYEWGDFRVHIALWETVNLCVLLWHSPHWHIVWIISQFLHSFVLHCEVHAMHYAFCKGLNSQLTKSVCTFQRKLQTKRTESSNVVYSLANYNKQTLSSILTVCNDGDSTLIWHRAQVAMCFWLLVVKQTPHAGKSATSFPRAVLRRFSQSGTYSSYIMHKSINKTLRQIYWSTNEHALLLRECHLHPQSHLNLVRQSYSMLISSVLGAALIFWSVGIYMNISAAQKKLPLLCSFPVWLINSKRNFLFQEWFPTDTFTIKFKNCSNLTLEQSTQWQCIKLYLGSLCLRRCRGQCGSVFFCCSKNICIEMKCYMSASWSV